MKYLSLLFVFSCYISFGDSVAPFSVERSTEDIQSNDSSKSAGSNWYEAAAEEEQYWKYIEIDFDSGRKEYVRGLPFLLSFEIANNYDSLPSVYLDFLDLLKDNNPDRFELRDLTTEEMTIVRTASSIRGLFKVFDVLDKDVPVLMKSGKGWVSEPSSFVFNEGFLDEENEMFKYSGPEFERNGVFSIDGGESRGMLVDLGSRFGDEAFGSNEIELYLVSQNKGIPSYSIGKLDLTARDLDPNEVSQLDSLTRSKWREFNNPYDWVIADLDEDFDVLSLDSDIRDMLILYIFLNDAGKRRDAGKVRLELLDYFPEALASYAKLFEYETLVALGEIDASKVLREAALVEYPEMNWRFLSVDEDNGHIARVIEFHRRLSSNVGTGSINSLQSESFTQKADLPAEQNPDKKLSQATSPLKGKESVPDEKELPKWLYLFGVLIILAFSGYWIYRQR